jgi:hypothetical protein
VRSANTPHVRSDKETITVGLKFVQFKITKKSCISTCPVSEIIVDVKFKKPVLGLRKILLKVTTRFQHALGCLHLMTKAIQL